MSDRATEARERAESVVQLDGSTMPTPHPRALAEDVLWLLEERERFTEALRASGVSGESAPLTKIISLAQVPTPCQCTPCKDVATTEVSAPMLGMFRVCQSCADKLLAIAGS